MTPGDDRAPGVPCRLCGLALHAPVLDLGRQPLPDALLRADEPDIVPRVWLALARCVGCGLVQLAGVTSPAADVGHGHGGAVSSSSRAYEAAWAAQLARTLGGNRGRRRVLLLGDAGPSIIDPFLGEGHAVLTLPGPDANAVRASGPVDLVVANHALAHADSLASLLDAIADVVAPGGLVVIEFHDGRGILDGQFDVIGPAHRSYLTLDVAVTALEARGLTVVGVTGTDRYGGSIRLTAAREPRAGVGLRARPVRLGAAQDERLSGVDVEEAWRTVGKAAERVRCDLRAFLRTEAAEGRLVLGYGAPTRGTVLLNYANVGPDLLPLTVDRSPSKQGRRLPGCGIPIVAPEVLAVRRPDTVLVLAWPLLEEIMVEQAIVRDWGGRFAVAMPRLRVLVAAATPR